MVAGSVVSPLRVRVILQPRPFLMACNWYDQLCSRVQCCMSCIVWHAEPVRHSRPYPEHPSCYAWWESGNQRVQGPRHKPTILTKVSCLQRNQVQPSTWKCALCHPQVLEPPFLPGSINRRGPLVFCQLMFGNLNRELRTPRNPSSGAEECTN